MSSAAKPWDDNRLEKICNYVSLNPRFSTSTNNSYILQINYVCLHPDTQSVSPFEIDKQESCWLTLNKYMAP